MEKNWTAYFQQNLDGMMKEIETYVKIETPTHNKEAVDQLGSLIKERFLALGCKVEVIPQKRYGDQIRVEYGTGTEQILILGHFDTVKEIGTLQNEPWRIEDGKAYGPGIYDMKAGIVSAYFALKAIIDQQIPLNKKLVFFWNTDEEVGSTSSQAFIEKEAKQSTVSLVLEPAAAGGEIKTSRKGGGNYTLKVKGRASHAGADHAKGINAIEEIAKQIIKIQSWTNYEVGTTLSVGTIKGGTVSNVVPEYAEAEIDIRIKKTEEAARITQMFEQLTPVHPEAQLILEGGINKLPMERTERTEKLFLHAQEQAKLESRQLQEIAVGGMSDGNIVAAVGTTVLDGLGPFGDGAHAVHEHIVVDEVPFRTALLLRLLTTL